MSLPTSVSGFSIIPVSYSPSSTHYIYVRSHAGSKKASRNSLPDGRTLFMVNIPPDATERELAQLFKNCGTVEKVVFDIDGIEAGQEGGDDSDEDEDEGEGEDVIEESAELEADSQPRKRRKIIKDDTPKVVSLPPTKARTLRPTGRSAHLIFLDSSSLQRALSTATKTRPWPSSSLTEEPLGLSHYTLLYESLRPPLDIIKEHADSSILAYEHELQKKKQQSQYRKGEAIVDDDGFTLVTRGGAYGKTLGGGVGVASKKFQRTGQASKRNRNTKKEKETGSFYAFHKAEKQRIELMNLKKRWEEDKAKVEKLKASRKFKPY